MLPQTVHFFKYFNDTEVTETVRNHKLRVISFSKKCILPTNAVQKIFKIP